MKSNRKARGAFSAVTAGALVLGLTACDQIQSLWKSEDKTNPATGAVAQPKPAEGTIQVAKPVELPKSIEAPKPPVDENQVLKQDQVRAGRRSGAEIPRDRRRG